MLQIRLETRASKQAVYRTCNLSVLSCPVLLLYGSIHPSIHPSLQVNNKTWCLNSCLFWREKNNRQLQGTHHSMLSYVHRAYIRRPFGCRITFRRFAFALASNQLFIGMCSISNQLLKINACRLWRAQILLQAFLNLRRPDFVLEQEERKSYWNNSINSTQTAFKNANFDGHAGHQACLSARWPAVSLGTCRPALSYPVLSLR